MEIQSIGVSPQVVTTSHGSQASQPKTVAGAGAVEHSQTGAQAAEQASQHKPDEKSLQHAVDKANATIQNLSNELQFSVDKDTGEYVVKVVDKQTNEVVRQIPSKEMLEIAKRLDELRGMLIQQKA